MQSDHDSSASRFAQPGDPSPPGVDDRATYAAHTAHALATLTIAQRQVLVLSYFERLTQAQIAVRLSTPQATVRIDAASGLIALATEIEGDRRAG